MQTTYNFEVCAEAVQHQDHRTEHRHALNATTTFFTYRSSSDLIQQCFSLLTSFASQAVVCLEERANKMAGACIEIDAEDYTVTTHRGVYEALYTLASCKRGVCTTMGVICRHKSLVSWQTGRATDVCYCAKLQAEERVRAVSSSRSQQSGSTAASVHAAERTGLQYRLKRSQVQPCSLSAQGHWGPGGGVRFGGVQVPD
ncbi:unnamed protein product [Ixodes pacificus]